MVRKILRKKGMQTVLERYSASTEVIVTEFQFSNHKSIGGRKFLFLKKPVVRYIHRAYNASFPRVLRPHRARHRTF